MKILGISAFYHDAAAAIIEDGSRKGKDSLKKKVIGQESYFAERNHQFTAEDFKKTW